MSDNISKSISPNFSKIRISLANGFTNKNSHDFTKILKAKKIKHFSRGTKYANSLLTRIRFGRSDLNQHKCTIGLTGSPECDCHFTHYFID